MKIESFRFRTKEGIVFGLTLEEVLELYWDLHALFGPRGTTLEPPTRQEAKEKRTGDISSVRFTG